MNKKEYKIIESRKISNEEYTLITNLLDKYKMDKKNFINNAKALVFNKVDTNDVILNGYDAEKNVISYNDKSNIICELLHVASSNGDKQQGICIRPNKVYSKSMGFSLNEGITDLFLEYANKQEGFFPFEKICAKVLEYAYGTDIFNYYFLSDDGEFRHLFDRSFINLLMNLDDYSDVMRVIRLKLYKEKALPDGVDNAMKIYMDIVVEDLLNVVKDSKKDCKKYLNKLLSSDAMRPIYDIVGEYQYVGEVKR